MSDQEFALDWLDPRPAWLSNLYATVDDDAQGLALTNYSLRPCRVTVYADHAGGAAAAAGTSDGSGLRRIVGVQTIGDEDWLCSFLGVTQNISGSNSLFGSIPLFGGFWHADLDVPLRSWHPGGQRFRIDVVGPSFRLRNINGTMTEPRDFIDQEVFHDELIFSSSMTRWTGLWFGFWFNQVALPIIETASGVTLDRADKRLLVKVIGPLIPGLFATYQSNAPISQTVLKVLKAVFGNPEVVTWAGQKLLTAAATNFLRGVSVFISIADLTLTYLDVDEALDDLSTNEALYQAFVVPSSVRPVIDVDPAHQELVALDDVGIDLSATFQVPINANGHPLTRRVDTAGRLVGARGSINGGTLELDDVQIVGDDGTPTRAPLRIRLSSTGDPGLLRPSAWDPALGSYAVGVAFLDGLRPVFEAAHAGTGAVVAEIASYELAEMWTNGVLVYNASDESEVDVSHAVPVITVADTQVDAGQRAGVDLRVEWPHEPGKRRAFDTADIVGAEIDVATDGASIELRNIQVQHANQWTANLETVPLGFGIRLAVAEDATDSGDSSHGPAYRFVHPTPDIVGGSGPPTFVGLDAFVKGLRPGEAIIEVTVIDIADPRVFAAPDKAEAIVTVSSRLLDIEFDPFLDPNGNGDLVLEDEWDNELERLSAALAVRVSDVDGVLFDTSEVAMIVGVVDANRLLAEEIWVEQADGTLEPLAFGLEMRLDLPEVAAFDLRNADGVEIWGSFSAYVSLGDVVTAVGPGRAELSVEIVPPTIADTDNDIVYLDTGGSSRLPVDVPPPLEPHLVKYLDAHFTEQMPIDLTTSPVEVMYNAGTVFGTIGNHREQSTTEEVDLVIAPPTAPDIDLVLRSDSTNTLDGSGGFQQQISGLTTNPATGSGDNIFVLLAWKPINQIVAGEAAEATASVIGVLPRRVGPTEMLVPGPARTDLDPQVLTGSLDATSQGLVVARRDIDHFEFTHERSTSHAVEFVRITPEGEQLGALQRAGIIEQPAYGAADETYTSLRLPAQAPELFEVRGTAWNDFGQMIHWPFDGPTITTALPSITGISRNTHGHPRNPAATDAIEFGNDGTSLGFSCVFDATLSMNMMDEATPANDTGRAVGFRESFDTELPRQGQLVAGTTAVPNRRNRFQIVVRNEFGAVTHTEDVWRRGDVWTIKQGSSVTWRNRHEDGPIGYRVWVEITDLAGSASVTVNDPNQFNIAAITTPEASLGFRRARFQGVRVTNSGTVPEQMPLEISLDLVTDDPNYFDHRAFMVIRRSRVTDWPSAQFIQSFDADGLFGMYTLAVIDGSSSKEDLDVTFPQIEFGFGP